MPTKPTINPVVALGYDRNHMPQDPFFPIEQPDGPTFIDTEACLCELRPNPEDRDEDNIVNLWWRCFGNRTAGAETETSGKWFPALNEHPDGVDLMTVLDMEMNDDTNPPDLDSFHYHWNTYSKSFMPGQENMPVWDEVCTGKNHTGFTTSFYRAAEQLERGEVPVDAAPCWRPGAMPMTIQNVSDWQLNGCKEGFLCA